MDTARHEFTAWPTDLLIDYALKVHHRNIREKGPKIMRLIRSLSDESKVVEEIERLFGQSLADLENHLLKEERVLFPYLYDLLSASREGVQIAPMHCGTISHPINAMMMEHDGEVQRHQQIRELTDNYTAPADASDDYKLLVGALKEFSADLHEHIHIENDMIFPRCQAVERVIVL